MVRRQNRQVGHLVFGDQPVQDGRTDAARAEGDLPRRGQHRHPHRRGLPRRRAGHVRAVQLALVLRASAAAGAEETHHGQCVSLQSRFGTGQSGATTAVSVNDVAPDGQSTVLASGQLAASLHAVDDDRSQQDANGDYTHTVYKLLLADRQPLVPGQPTTLDVAINPVDAVLQPGHRLRVNVFAGNFSKGILVTPLLFDGGIRNAAAPQHLQLDPNEPSFINLTLNRPVE
ncbi:hypothetical protein GFY24_11590 [Nocardia sp. SYP-A9097]|nr:CocE/NonD family hydrolase C-terminal non-catalytic domain-containing protein [Nocardia sp. SYP-A9097]MRH88077.1 hypothetical protein [Nocardia sp. SYP-A9097]